MEHRLKYDIPLPASVDEMLDADFWVMDPITKLILSQVSGAFRLSATTTIFVRSGRCKADINLLEQAIEAPCIVTLREGNYLSLKEMSDDLSLGFIVMSKQLVDSIFLCLSAEKRFQQLVTPTVIPLEQRYVEAYEKLYDSMRRLQATTDNPFNFQAALHTMVGFFFGVGHKSLEAPREGKVTAYGRLIEQFLMLAKQNFRSERFLDYYANRLEVTPKHLSRVLKAQTGSSAVEWIDKFVLIEAKIMLTSTNLPIQKIADELSFPSQSTFGKFFKKHTGLSPKAFRGQ